MHALDVSVLERRRQKDALYQELDQQRERIQQFRVEIARIEGQERALDEAEERATSTRAELAQRAEQVVLEERQVSERLRQQEERVEAVASQLSELGALSAIEAELRTREQQLRDEQIRLAKEESEQQALSEQLLKVAAHAKQATGEQGDERVLLSGIKVPEKFEKAVHAVLGERGQYLVADDLRDKARAFTERETRAKVGLIDASGAGVAEGSLSAVLAVSSRFRQVRPLLVYTRAARS